MVINFPLSPTQLLLFAYAITPYAFSLGVSGGDALC